MAEQARRRSRTRPTKTRINQPERLLVQMIAMLQDRESKPYMIQQVELLTSHTQQVFRRVYGKLSDALYRSDEVLMTVNPVLAVRVQAVVDKNYQQLYDELSKEEMRLDSLQEAEGVSGKISYTAQKEENAVIYSPRAMRFVILMRTLDRVINKIDLLHICGIIETNYAALAKYTWQKRVIRFANEIIMASNAALSTTRSDLVEKTRAERERLRERVAQAEAGGTVIELPEAAQMPAEHEIDQAMAHEIEEVSAVAETEEEERVSDSAVRRRGRVPLAAAAG